MPASCRRDRPVSIVASALSRHKSASKLRATICGIVGTTFDGRYINIKNRLIGWATKNNRAVTFEIVEERIEKGRRLFVIGVMLDGEVVATGRGFNKKDASQLAAQEAVVKLEL